MVAWEFASFILLLSRGQVANRAISVHGIRLENAEEIKQHEKPWYKGRDAHEGKWTEVGLRLRDESNSQRVNYDKCLVGRRKILLARAYIVSCRRR